MFYPPKLARLRSILSLSFILCGLLTLAACNVRPPAHPHDHNHGSSGFTDYTGPEDGIWPPQPRNMTNLKPFTSAELSGALTEDLEAQFVQRVLQKSEVRAALGQRYAYLQSEQVRQKGEASQTILVFFSYSHNQTVEVSDVGGSRVEVRTFAPDAYQPPEGEGEVKAAVQLARAKLLEKGFDDVGRLGGGALMAFKGGAAGESGFFDNRVLYVTFATGPDTLPQYFAYVDLTSQSVLEHGPIN